MDEQKFPYDDDYMKYDYKHHRYVLTEKCLFDELGINLSETLNTAGDANNTAVVNRTLAKVSRELYSWIYTHGGNNVWQEYMLAKYPPLREVVKEMLIEMAEYILGESDIASRSGINFNKNSFIDRDVLERAQVPIIVKNLANQILPCGKSILYCGLNVGVAPCMVRWGY